jgi:hypothetical protein
VQECISQMRNHEKANAATHWLVKRLPRGADKVLAAVGLGKNLTCYTEAFELNSNIGRYLLEIMEKLNIEQEKIW